MNKSETISALAAALVKAQAKLKNPQFDSSNPHFKSRYASLAAVRDAVIPVLSEHGIAVSQFPLCGRDGDTYMAGCETIVMHMSGEFISSAITIPVDKANAHGVGSAQTYAKRYALMGVAGVVGDEDDEGNAAVETKKPAVADPAGKKALEACQSLDDLQTVWQSLTPAQRATLGPAKDAKKEKLLAPA